MENIPQSQNKRAIYNIYNIIKKVIFSGSEKKNIVIYIALQSTAYGHVLIHLSTNTIHIALCSAILYMSVVFNNESLSLCRGRHHFLAFYLFCIICSIPLALYQLMDNFCNLSHQCPFLSPPTYTAT
jgi:hypothetical protein